MKKVFIVAFIFISSITLAQTEVKRPDAGIFLPQVGQNAVSQFSTENPPTQNVVFIQQTGLANFTQINSSGNNAISVTQDGDNNYVSLDAGNVSLTENIIQLGNNNSVISSYGTYTAAQVNSQIIQEGVGLSVLRIGTNSITENLKINLEGTGREIIIRSYQ